MTRAIVKAAPLAPITITFDPLAVDAANAAAIEELNGLQGASIDTDAEAAEAAELLRDVVREKDAIASMRDKLLRPVEALKKAVNDLFKPAYGARAASEEKIKSLIKAFQLAKLAEQRKQLAAASQAASARQPEAMSTALIAAHDAAPAKLDGVGFRPKWVARIKSPDLVPYEWCTPDVKRIDEHARKTPVDDEPTPIPGVLFERDASVSARR